MGRILVADSDPNVLLLCHEELREEGYEVLVASNAREALGLMEEACPDVVVLEMMLPDMSGFETLNIIKGTCRHTPVIFHSMYSLPKTWHACQADGVVLKTHNLDSLKSAVRRFLPDSEEQGGSSHHPRGTGPARPQQRVCHGLNGN